MEVLLMLSQSELVEDFNKELDIFIEKYYNIRQCDEQSRFDRLILPYIEDLKVKLAERLEPILEDELLSSSFEGE